MTRIVDRAYNTTISEQLRLGWMGSSAGAFIGAVSGRNTNAQFKLMMYIILKNFSFLIMVIDLVHAILLRPALVT